MTHLATPLDLSSAAKAIFTLRHSDRHPFANVARFRLYATGSAQVGPTAPVPDDVRAVLLTAADKRDDKQKKRLTEYYQSIAPELKEPREALATAKKAETEFSDRIPVTAVLEELPADKQRKT